MLEVTSMSWAMLVLTLVAGVVGAGTVFIVLYRAVSNLVDWIIVTFGNASVEEVERPRPSDQAGCAGGDDSSHSKG